MTREEGRYVAIVLGIALVLRVLAVLVDRHSYVPLNDARDFDNIATSIANGHGYGPITIPPAMGPGAFRAPLYPAVLAAVYAVVGDHSWTAGRLENALLGTVLVALIWVIARQLWGARVAAVAVTIAAIHPTLILIGSGLQLEPLLVSLSLGSLAAALQHRRSPHGLRWPLASGVLLGLAILTREMGFALVVPIALILWPRRDGPETAARGVRALAAPVAFLAIAALTVVPWTIRNAFAFHAFEPVSSSSGFGLAGTYNATSMGQRCEWVRPYDDPTLVKALLALRDPTEADVDRVMRKEALDFMKEHPTYIGEVALWGSIRLFDLDGGAYDRHVAKFIPYSQGLVWLSVLATYPMLLLAALGARRREARAAPLAMWAIPLLIVLEIVVLLPANVRYRASAEPFFVLLAALAVTPYVERWWGRTRPRREEPALTASRTG